LTRARDGFTLTAMRRILLDAQTNRATMAHSEPDFESSPALSIPPCGARMAPAPLALRR
jgi:hypothetical protein